jgi:hypothetical protein
MARPFLARWRDLVASSPLTTTQRAIAWRAADYANGDGSRCYPSSVRLAQDCGLSVATGEARNKAVERAFAALLRCGLAVRVSAGHRGSAAHYELVIPGEERGTPQTPIPRERGTDGSHKGGPLSPPTNPDHGGAANAARRRSRHSFRDDGSGQSCEACGLPSSNAAHRLDQVAS